MQNFNVAALMSPTKRPLIATFVGDGGMGKTTLGSLFPAPVFIRTEDGTQAIAHRQDVALFPVCKTTAQVKEAINSLRTEAHPFQTLVIDSITQLDVMIQAEIVAADGKAKSINAAGGGYGAGWNMVSNAHREIRELAGMLSEEREMNIIFLAHAQNETVDSPDSDSYLRATMRLNSKSVGHYSDNVDLVGFLKLKTYVTGDDTKKRAIGDGTRVIACYPTPSHISKNRFGITTDLPFDGQNNPFAAFLGGK
jgi:hypothetical protein